MYKSLQQHYLGRYTSYLQKVRLVQKQIALIFELKQDLSSTDYDAIQYALMQVLAQCGLIGDPQKLFVEAISMQQPDKDQLMSFVDKIMQILTAHRNKIAEATNDIEGKKEHTLLLPS